MTEQAFKNIVESLNRIKLTLETMIQGEAYSYKETATNKRWVDGKRIFRKVIDLESMPEATTADIDGTVVNFNAYNGHAIIEYTKT